MWKVFKKHLITGFNDRWTKCNRTKDRSLNRNTMWLDGEFKVQLEEVPLDITPTTSGKRGWPPKSYENLSDKENTNQYFNWWKWPSLRYKLIYSVSGTNKADWYWQNPACSSMRYCEPILVEFSQKKTRSVVGDSRDEINKFGNFQVAQR